jgi:hypothetical protein
MSIKLSDTQLVMLSAAAQREDRNLRLPEKLRGGVAHKAASCRSAIKSSIES